MWWHSPGRVELASSLSNWHAEVPRPGVAALFGVAAQTNLLLVESVRYGSLICRGVLTTPPFVGPFCRTVGAAQPWHTAPLTLKPKGVRLISSETGLGLITVSAVLFMYVKF